MNPINQSRFSLSKQKNLDSFIAAVLGFCIVYLFTTFNGIGVSPDSVIYTSVTRDLLKGQGLTEFDGMPMTIFPFFYPCFLAVVSFITHTDVIVLAPILNSFLFAIVIYLSGCIMEKFMQPFKYYKWVVLATIATAPCLLDVFSMLWTETLFTLLILLFFVSAKQYFNSKYQLKYLLLLAFIASMATVTRYAGVTLIGAGAIFFLLDNKLLWQKKCLHLILFGIVSFSLLTANLIRNKIVTGGFTGHRLKSITPLFTNWHHYGNVMYEWLQLHFNTQGYVIIGTLVFVFACFLIVYQIIKKQYSNSYENMASIFFIVYISFIVLSATVSRYEPINNRLLEPAYISFLWAASYFLPMWINKIKINKGRTIAIYTFLILSVLFLFTQIRTTKSIYKDILDDGIGGYTSKSYQNASPIIRWIKLNHNQLNPNYPIYSNVNDCLYFYTGIGAQAIPETVRKDEVDEYLTTEPHYIIWFGGDIDNPNIYRLDTIQKYRHLDTLKQLLDGGVYWCGYKK